MARLNEPEYSDSLTYLKIYSLENDEISLYKIIHNLIDTSLTHSLSDHNQVRLIRQPHQQRTFHTPHISPNIEFNAPIHRMQEHDRFFSQIDLFNESFYLFKSQLKKQSEV